VHYGLLADIHGNLRAFQLALACLEQARVDQILFLGDLVGYCAEPGECIDLMRSLPNALPICGNHDRNVLGEPDPNMRRTAAFAIKWTQEVLTADQLGYLKSLPQGRTLDEGIIMVHGSLASRDAYILNLKEVEANRKLMLEVFTGMKLCFFAHTHVPMLVGTKSLVTDLRETKAFRLDRDDVYLINPGSVGQPRDKCPLASFGIFDSGDYTMTFFRRPYDVAGARNAILAAGLPEKFARRLEVGV